MMKKKWKKNLAAEIPLTFNLRNRKLSLKSRAFAKPTHHIEEISASTSQLKMEAISFGTTNGALGLQRRLILP